MTNRIVANAFDARNEFAGTPGSDQERRRHLICAVLPREGIRRVFVGDVRAAVNVPDLDGDGCFAAGDGRRDHEVGVGPPVVGVAASDMPGADVLAVGVDGSGLAAIPSL